MSSENNNIQLPFTTSHAFIIGINDYEHLTPLSTAVNDARVLAKRLAEDHGYQVHPPLLNANRAAIMQLLEVDLPRLVSEEDRILFYFAGHGIALDSDDDPKGYLVPVDAKPGDPETLLAMDTFHDAITKLPCKHGLLVLDCCFAGAFKWSTGFRDVMFDLPGIIYQERFYQYTQDPAWQVITSSASDQKAVDILSDRTLGMRSTADAKHSPFATALLAGLAGEADTVPKEKGDGVITATELYTYLRDRVEDETTEEGKRQSPAMFSLQRHDKGQYIFLHPRHVLNLPPIPDRNPFMGLKSYNETDSNLFYGRDRVIVALADLAAEQPLIVVSGASGTGKSSVIKAGLLPSLRKDGWHILPVIRPGKSPMESLQSGLPDLNAVLKKEGKSILIVDQYEELITQCLDPQERLDFEAQLADWLQTYPQLRIVLSIRSDFEPQFEEGALANWWQKGRYVVPVFSQDELREVIIKPTVQEVLFFESDILVDKLLEAVNQAPGALPLLSFTLSELYHAYLKSGRTNRAFTLEDYEKLGGVIGALRTRANAIYNELDQAHQDSMRKLMLRMVSLEGGELASRRVASSDLVFSNPAESERLQNVAQQLVTARLISTGVDPQGQTFFEPAHDALVRAWARLWEWIKAQGEGRLGLMYKLSLAVTDYEINQKNEYLWNDDPRLDLLLADLQIKGHVFNAKEEAFLQESNALRQKNKRRRAGIIAAVMIGLLGLAAFAFYEQGIAKDAQLQASQEAKNALLAQKNAERSDSIAQREAKAAKNALLKAEESDAFARLQADTARIERDNALWQTGLARQAQNRAEQRTKEAQSAALAAKARELRSNNPTIAFNIASAAYKKWPTEESKSVLLDFFSDSKVGFTKRTYAGHESAVVSIAFSPDKQMILTGSWDGTAKLWSIDGNLLRTFTGHKETVYCVAFSPDGKKVLTGGDKGIAKLWAINGKELRSYELGASKSVTSVAFSPNGNNILTGTWGGIVKRWSLSGEELQSFNGQEEGVELHEQRINSLAFSPNGEAILAGSWDGTAKLWSLTGEKLQTFSGHSARVNSVAFSPNGEKILTGSSDNTAKLWSLDGNELKSYNGHKTAIGGVAFSPNGQSILIGDEDGVAKTWSLEGEELRIFMGHGRIITSVAFSPDGEEILTGSRDGTAKLWSLMKPLLKTFASHDSGLTSVALSPDNQTVLTGGYDGKVKLWSITGKELESFIADEEGILSVAFSPNGQSILTGGGNETVKLWSLNGTMLQSFNHEGGMISSVAFSPSGQQVLTGSIMGTIKLWSLKGKELKTITNPGDYGSLSSVIFSPNGSQILAGSWDRTAKIWSLNGEELQVFTGHEERVTSIAFSPDGQLVLTGCNDLMGSTKLWSLNGKELFNYEGDECCITSVNFSPDGQMVLISNKEGTVKLWSLNGKEINTIHAAQEGIVDATFSSDGRTILTGGDDGTAKLWRNIYGEWATGTIWKDILKLTPMEQAEYGIDWKY
ncbi:MAG: eIF2A-related protein [Lewinella sp.]|uniref:nSTAND1 domain-containing NTPase n=1 Tax=Lewinella sp. TaxID=2004506 RepID=UPI003D6C12AE